MMLEIKGLITRLIKTQLLAGSKMVIYNQSGLSSGKIDDKCKLSV